MKTFNGKILFLDRSDINTDEIIPARYLTEISKEALKPYLLEDLKLEGFDPPKDISGKSVVISRENFGCGSSREHAPWAFEVNGINLVIATNFARIFKQNMFNCGMMAIELPAQTMDKLFADFGGKEAECQTDLEKNVFTIQADGQSMEIPFELGGYNRTLVESNGWVNLADGKY